MTDEKKPSELEEFDHEWESEGGPGGIVNTPPEFHPEGWAYVEGESSPPVQEG